MTSLEVSLKDCIAPPFYPVHAHIEQKILDSFWLKGGRGSTKSSFVAIEIILGIMADPLANAVAIRKVNDTIRTSVLATFIWAMDVLKVSQYFRVTNSPAEITYKMTGQQILMKGLDDPQKLKSIKAKKGYFKYLWFEEAAELTDLAEMESVTQSVMRGGEEYVEFVTYNPPVEPKAWINVAAREKNPEKCMVHESNYTQVDPKWLGSKFLEDAAEMLRMKPDKYAHIYMGQQIGRSDAIIFSGCYNIETFEVVHRDGVNYIHDKPVEGPYYGADWGFSQDPNVLVKVWVCVVSREIFIEYEKYGIGVELDEIPAMFDQIPDSRKYKIRADCSRPETISHVKARGFNIEAADKWPGSVEDGITVLKAFRIIIHTRCTGLQEEAIKYSYKIDRLTREVTADIVDKWNHGWDAVRYALAPLIKPKPRGIFGSGVLGQKR